ncbi:MAG TPA: VOC family protein [Steroidobacteraceae bacterium]|nr:VOC family protein [Steroidobacteraceae bacterium]
MAVKELFAYLIVADASAAIQFYSNAFGAKEKLRLAEPSGRIGHAELDFNGATLMLADEYPELNLRAPKRGAGTAVSLHLHVDNADEVINRAIEHGAKMDRPPVDQFFGERSGSVIDPFGHRWLIGHQVENVSHEDMQRRYDEVMKGG